MAFLAMSGPFYPFPFLKTRPLLTEYGVKNARDMQALARAQQLPLE